MTLISVVIPVYNGGKTISETIQSVLNQTHTDLEIIVINDGSNDSTLDIIQYIKDSRLRVFSYANAGQAVSRNRGIAQAQGEYISFLDADDLWTPDKLMSELVALLSNPQADVACSWTNYINENGKVILEANRINLTGNAYPYLLLTNLLESGSNLFVRREKLLEIGNYDESPLIKSAEDWDLYLRLASKYQFVTVPKPQILYRISTHSMSTDIGRIERSSLQVIEKNFAQAPKSLQYLKKYSLANLYKYLIHKSLEQFPSPQQNLISLQMFQNVVINDPSILYKPVIIQIGIKFLLSYLLTPNTAYKIFTKFPLIFNVRIGSCMRFYP